MIEGAVSEAEYVLNVFSMRIQIRVVRCWMVHGSMAAARRYSPPPGHLGSNVEVKLLTIKQVGQCYCQHMRTR